MAYEKQTWVNGTTHVDAEHMNHIEDGLEAVAEIADANTDALVQKQNLLNFKQGVEDGYLYNYYYELS